MPSQAIRDLYEAYLERHDAAYFAEGASYLVVPLRREFCGQRAIAEFLSLLYRRALSHAWRDLRRLAVDPEQSIGVAEFTLKGRHTGELFGLPPSLRTVEIPMLEIDEFHQGRIERARLYYDSAALFEQLGALAPLKAGGGEPPSDTTRSTSGGRKGR